MAALNVDQPIHRVIDALANAGCNPRSAGPTQWNARCPVNAEHSNGDKNPSLSIGESPLGRVLVTCHRGCTTPRVCDSLGLSMRDLFPDTPKPPSNGRDRPEATYAYYDEDGTLLYEVVKIRQADGGKTFRARAPLPDGGWSHSAQGIRRVLYNLPQVMKAVAEGRPVVVCEGEKDAENAQWLWPDAACTTNPFGAGVGKWQAEYNEVLRGADVIIIADDDLTGHSHAWEIEINLRHIAKTTRMYLPALGYNDLSEMYGAGKGLPDLRPWGPGHTDPEVVDDFDNWATPTLALAVAVAEEDWAHLIDWPAFWEQDYPDEDWLLKPLIPRGRSVVIYAPAKVGKSEIVLHGVAALATSRKVYGSWTSPKVNVLYCDYEMTQADLFERMESFGYGSDDDLSHLHYCSIPTLGALDDAQSGGAQQLLALALKLKAQLVVIDTYGRAVAGDENDANTTRDFYRVTVSLLKAHGIAVLRLDHSGKDADKGQRGSSAKNDDVDIVWYLTRIEGGAQLRATHRRQGWVNELVVLHRNADDSGKIDWVHTDEAAVPAGTKRAIDDLDELDIDINMSSRAASKVLRVANRKGTDKAIRAAQRFRQQRAAEKILGSVPVHIYEPGEPKPLIPGEEF